MNYQRDIVNIGGGAYWEGALIREGHISKILLSLGGALFAEGPL